jgi:hypothetical protein
VQLAGDVDAVEVDQGPDNRRQAKSPLDLEAQPAAVGLDRVDPAEPLGGCEGLDLLVGPDGHVGQGHLDAHHAVYHGDDDIDIVSLDDIEAKGREHIVS